MRKQNQECWRRLNRLVHGLTVVPFATTMALFLALMVATARELVWYRDAMYVALIILLVIFAGLMGASLVSITRKWSEMMPCFDRDGNDVTTFDTLILVSAVMPAAGAVLIFAVLIGPMGLEQVLLRVMVGLMVLALALSMVLHIVYRVLSDNKRVSRKKD